MWKVGGGVSTAVSICINRLDISAGIVSKFAVGNSICTIYLRESQISAVHIRNKYIDELASWLIPNHDLSVS